MFSPTDFIFPQIDPKILLFLGLFSTFWVLPWKGVALWKAARNSHKKWFIAIFLLNTLSILEILYIFIFSKKMQKGVGETGCFPAVEKTATRAGRGASETEGFEERR